MLGTSIGNYKVTARIGEGGMGTVYLAEHTLLGRRAAVKVLLPQLSNHRDTVARFFNEARAATAIRHPSIVEIFDFGYLPSGSGYLVMEFLDGETLAARRARLGRFEPMRALALVRQIAGALAAAHDRGIVHRDLKPDNLFVVADPEVPGGERIKVLDFGIAKLVGNPVDASRTQTGMVLGTPTYIAPEQCRGSGDVDARADLYALGCVCYELVCGHPPFVVDGAGELIAHHLYFEPQSPRSLQPAIPEAVDKLILWLLRKQPSARPQSARELVEAIDRLGAAAAAVVSLPGAPAAAPSRPTPVPAPRAPTPPGASSPALPAQSTTLSAATGMTAPRAGSPRPRWLIPAVAAVTATAGIAIVLVASGSRGPTVSAPKLVEPAATPAPRSEPAAPTPPAPPPSEPVKPADVHLRLDSDPSGAAVLVDGTPIGMTPLDDRVTAGGARRIYTIAKDGYEPATVALDTAHDGSQRVVLKKQPAKPATAPEPNLGDRGVNPFDH